MVLKHGKGPGAAGNLLFLNILIINQMLLNLDRSSRVVAMRRMLWFFSRVMLSASFS